MKSTRILVIDDDAAVLHALRRVLEAQFTLCCTTSPVEAPALAASFDPDIAICDVQMPQVSGFELLDKLRAAATDVDVILMTGSITDQDTHLIRALRQRAFYFILKPFERDVLLALVERCEEMQRLRRSERGHLTRMREELMAAQAFQQTMLAPSHDQAAGFVVDVLCQPCSEVGGDFYDYAITPDGQLAFILADVRGHGVPAALLTATVKTLFRSAALKGGSPAELAESLVHALQFFAEDQFMTAFCGLACSKRDRLEYVNAGHPAAMLFGADGTLKLLDSAAPLLSGLFPEGSWPAASTSFPTGSKLFIHTDGFNGGVRRVDHPLAIDVNAVLASGQSGQARLSALVALGDQEQIASSHLTDDVTLMLLERA